MFGGEERHVLAASNALDYDPDLPDDPVPVRPENVVRKQVTFMRVRRPVAVLEMLTRARCIRCRLAAVGGDHLWRHVNAVRHHDDDAASVLGTVQGSALRSDRACARPSGLDGACAQMIPGN
jgi:hypothetical protein